MRPEDRENLEIADFEAQCPLCKRIAYPFILMRIPAVQHVPARLALLCPVCNTPWYKKIEEN